jgi:hypothetical protein
VYSTKSKDEVCFRALHKPVTRLAEHREGRASLVCGQADACPSQRFASPTPSAGWRAKMETFVSFVPLCEIELGCGLRPRWFGSIEIGIEIDREQMMNSGGGLCGHKPRAKKES